MVQSEELVPSVTWKMSPEKEAAFGNVATINDPLIQTNYGFDSFVNTRELSGIEVLRYFIGH